MNEYDATELEKFFNNRDYLGAADYLSKFPPKRERYDEYEKTINELRRQGEIQNSILQNSDEKTKEAYHFINGLNNNGTIPSKYNQSDNQISNRYGDRYMDLINGLKQRTDKGFTGDSITKIQIDVNDEQLNTLKSFASEKGMNLNISSSSNGNYIATFDTTDKHIIPIIHELSKTKNNTEFGTAREIPALSQSVQNWFNKRNSNILNNINKINPNYIKQLPVSKIGVKGVTEKGNVIQVQDFNFSNLIQANYLVNEAEQEYNKIGDRQMSFDEEVVVSPFLGKGQAEAYEMLSNGVIDRTQYDKIVNERTEVYNRLLLQAGLQDNEVYTTDAEDDKERGTIFTKIDNINKRDVMEQIQVAMKENRLTYSAAMVAGETGTYITIIPKPNKGKDSDLKYEKGLRVFVKGLFKSSCDETFERNTQQAAIRDNVDMRHWNYGKFLSDGTYVGYQNGEAYTLSTNENGESVKVPISQEYMLQQLNKENIVRQAVSKLSSQIDGDGNPLTYTDKNGTHQYDIENIAQVMSAAAVNELYSSDYYSLGQRLYEQNNIYNLMIKMIDERLSKYGVTRKALKQ